MSAGFAHATFLENLGSKFRVDNGSSDSLELELIEVSELKQTGQHETFSIVFRCPSSRVLEQRIYRLEQESGDKLDLFLVPIRQDQQGVCYEAVFNLARSKC